MNPTAHRPTSASHGPEIQPSVADSDGAHSRLDVVIGIEREHRDQQRRPGEAPAPRQLDPPHDVPPHVRVDEGRERARREQREDEAHGSS